MNMQSIDLHIEELVLYGFAREERDEIGETLQHELQRLFIEHGLPQALQEDGPHHVAQLNADTIIVKPGASIGEQLAHSLYAGLSSNGANRPTQARKDQ